MRLFIALDLSDGLRKRVSTLFPLNLSGAKPVPPGQLHLTLRFLGETGETSLVPLKKLLGEIRFPNFFLHPRGIGTFPNPQRPRVLWLGFQNSSELTSLQAGIEEAVQKLGVPPEARPFSPHLTLARFKYSRPREVENFLGMHAGFSAEPWEVREFILYSSRLTPQGALHTPERRYSCLPEVP